VIGSNVTLYNGVTLGSKRAGEAYEMPTLGNNVTVYTGAKLFGGVRIGESVEIGALSLCTKDVPAHSVMYGIPPNVTVKPRSRAT
jgi:serine O-acetyltransferase